MQVVLGYDMVSIPRLFILYLCYQVVKARLIWDLHCVTKKGSSVLISYYPQKYFGEEKVQMTEDYHENMCLKEQ